MKLRRIDKVHKVDEIQETLYTYDHRGLVKTEVNAAGDGKALIYDGNGNYVATRTETSEVLADENWRMVIDLPAGDYHLIAYGGTACEEAAYTTATPQAGHHYTAMGHEMKAERVGTHLHDLYYGSLDMDCQR